MSGRTLVAVLGGGRSSEHDVSTASAAAVADALAGRYDVLRVTLRRDGSWATDDGELKDASLAQALEVIARADVVFPVFHGVGGEDGTVAGLLDLLDVPYVGSGVRAGALGMDKWATKLVAEAIGVATAPGVLVTDGRLAAAAVPLPVVVKPVAAGSSHGVSFVEDAADLPAALAAAAAEDPRVLVEQLVRGREVDVAVLEHPNGTLQVGPPLEIALRPGTSVFDTTTKYDGGAVFTVPAQLPDGVVEQLRDAAVAVFRALGCRGLARVDFFLTDAGLVLNEINTMPGMTEHSQVPRMFAAAGLDYQALADVLVRTALSRR